MQATILPGKCTESRAFYEDCLPVIFGSLCDLEDLEVGVPVVCVDDECVDGGPEHTHYIPFAFKVCCDLKALKEMCNRVWVSIL